jgi:AraC-like DNA-binding protein
MAHQLLKSSRLDIERIAERTGFASSRQLRRAWQRSYDSPPMRCAALKTVAALYKGFRAPAFAENGSSSAKGFVSVSPATSFPPAFCAQHSAAYCLPYLLGILASANPNIKP